ncbi:hypothetical protein JVX93_21680 [Mycolicibacterium boenickei]|nr:hypothetical protein JVX93_21680 [Mycolicibacterium boenickei]
MTDPDREVFLNEVREAIAPFVAPKSGCNCSTCVDIATALAAQAAIDAMVRRLGPEF